MIIIEIIVNFSIAQQEKIFQNRSLKHRLEKCERSLMSFLKGFNLYQFFCFCIGTPVLQVRIKYFKIFSILLRSQFFQVWELTFHKVTNLILNF